MNNRLIPLKEAERNPDNVYQLGSVELTGAEICRMVRDAKAVRENSYAPSSDFNIGAVFVFENAEGKRAVFRGTNVENAAFGDTICAERAAIVHAVSCGFRKLLAGCVVPDFDSTEEVTPCGSCRQVINEFAVEDCPILLVDPDDMIHVYVHEDLLSGAFGPRSLGMDPSTYTAGHKKDR